MAEDRGLASHGAKALPAATVENYNLDIRHRGEILNNRVRRGAFFERLEELRKQIRKFSEDPLGDAPALEIGKKQLGSILNGDAPEPAALVQTAVERFADDVAEVLRHYLADKRWAGVGRIVVGGGFSEGVLGARTIAAATLRLREHGLGAELTTIRHHPDEAGLLGALHLMPTWMFAGHDAILAADIGGSNIRAGVVLPRLKEAKDASQAKVWKSELWRHAEEDVRRTRAVEWLVETLQEFIARADKEGLSLAPFIGIGCPGVIEADGTISRGGMNLPGGNWDDARFNLPAVVSKAIPRIGAHETLVLMHNDAVVQGMSQAPYMTDVKRWGVITIGTGLGNASFTNTRE